MIVHPLRVLLLMLCFWSASESTVAAEENAPLVIHTSDNRYEFQVEVADTPSARALGLMYRRRLATDHGMLFDFGRDGPVSMWMKNTYVALDMIFVTSDGRVHRIAPDQIPHSLDIVRSEGSVRAVLELPAGTAARIGLKAGDRLEHRLFSER